MKTEWFVGVSVNHGGHEFIIYIYKKKENENDPHVILAFKLNWIGAFSFLFIILDWRLVDYHHQRYILRCATVGHQIKYSTVHH